MAERLTDPRVSTVNKTSCPRQMARRAISRGGVTLGLLALMLLGWPGGMHGYVIRKDHHNTNGGVIC